MKLTFIPKIFNPSLCFIISVVYVIFPCFSTGFDIVRLQEKLRGSETAPVDVNELRRQLLYVDLKLN